MLKKHQKQKRELLKNDYCLFKNYKLLLHNKCSLLN